MFATKNLKKYISMKQLKKQIESEFNKSQKQIDSINSASDLDILSKRLQCLNNELQRINSLFSSKLKELSSEEQKEIQEFTKDKYSQINI